VPGTWSFVDPSTVLGAGTHANVPVILTPNDTGSYDVVPVTVTVTVNKATPILSQLKRTPVTYGQPLSSSRPIVTAAAPVGGALPRGTLSFAAPTTTPNAGTANETVTSAPADGADYNFVTTTVQVHILKDHPGLSAAIRTKKPAGGKLVSVLLGGMTKGAKETLIIQNPRGRT